MKAILIMLNNPFCEVTESDCFQLSLDDAPTAAKRIFSAAQAVEFPGKDVVALYLDDASKLTERTMSSQKVKQREILVTLLHADEELINVDEKYRKKMILELSHSGAPKVINSCMELAILDGIDRAEVWLEHTRWLFQQDDYVITNVLDTTFPFITSNFNLIFTNILEIFKLASKKSDFATMTLYQAAIEANNSTKYLDDSDLEQLKLRVSIMQMLHSKKVKMPLNRLIDAKEHGLVKYLEIWKEFGLYMGLPNFLACLNSWIMLKPLTFLQEGFQLVQDSEHLLSKITSEVVYLHFASVASGLRDDIKAQSLLKEVASTFDHIFPLHLTDMISNILYCNTIPVGLRITLYAMAKPFLDNIDELLALNSHLNTIAKLQKYDFDGETVPSESCRLFEESFGNLDLAYQEITSLIRKGKPFLFVKFLCESFGFKPNEVYLYVVEKLLHSGDLDLLEKIVKSITAMQVQEEDFFEGWEIDDDLISSESNSTVFIVESILESIQLILKTYTLNSSTEHDKKMQIVTLLERVIKNLI